MEQCISHAQPTLPGWCHFSLRQAIQVKAYIYIYIYVFGQGRCGLWGVVCSRLAHNMSI